MNEKIGYIINESGIEVSDFQIIDEAVMPSKGILQSLDFQPSKDRAIGCGILQTGGERNRNGRIYRLEDLRREIAAPRQKELITTGNLLSEASHPLTTELVRQQTIDPRNSCARFLKLWIEGDNVMGVFQGTNNDLGETFDKDLKQGVKPAFSLRALGTVKATPQGAIVENLKMITYDYVIYPSHPGAYTQGLLNESTVDMGPTSNFKVTKYNDATKSIMTEFTNKDVINAIKLQSQNESAAIDYIKDKSLNFHLLKECYDMTSFDTIDFVSPKKIALTEAGKATIIMNVEDYIAREIQNYH